MTTTEPSPAPKSTFAERLPFFYGWIVVGVAFITMAIGVNARTSFSLLFPPILDEFGWDRATVSAAFSIGFMTSIILSPVVGVSMDRFGPRFVLPLGAVLSAAGFLLATIAIEPWHFYLTLGMLVVGGSLFISYIGHTTFLPNWFSRRRGLAVGIAFSGVGVGSIILFPWMQHSIDAVGWRETLYILAILMIVVIVPLNRIFQRRRPEDLGLSAEGDKRTDANTPSDNETSEQSRIVDRAWVETEWTLALAMKTSRFWWLSLSLVTGLYAWYAVQVHQTRFLIDVGIPAETAAIALGAVALTGIGGQIFIGHFSDRMGREWGWTLAMIGYLATYLLLLVLTVVPSTALAFIMVVAQGLLGYGLASVFGSVPVELFAGKRYGIIAGVLGGIASCGAAFGPWATGWLFDQAGNYHMAFSVAVIVCVISIVSMWIAAPRKVRLVAGRIPKTS
jgi:sugar phosphate permease